MSFLKRLGELLAPHQRPSFDERSHLLNVRCRRCGEIIPARIDLMNELSRDYDTGYYRTRKIVMGSGKNRCFQQIELNLVFDKNKQLIEQSAIGGEIVETPETPETNDIG
ncbi:MAG TPA: hypothetical protein G4N94_13045 [Caldilineae bacterium]|nr:hypothetical protein [Caldilineae bacterium]